jgi:hypothetical protein
MAAATELSAVDLADRLYSGMNLSLKAGAIISESGAKADNSALRDRSVICKRCALEAAVIPAKAGIHSSNLQKCIAHVLDSRFRGNDRRLVRDAIPNDTTTALRHYVRGFFAEQKTIDTKHRYDLQS